MNKTKRVIFLDYDGVLNDVEYLTRFHKKPGVHSGKDSLDPKRLSLLKSLCNMTLAKVVLTSSWRSDLETRKWLKSRWGIPIIGAIPRHNDNRSHEIHQWLVDSNFDGDYIIIDDEASEYNNTQRSRLICTREPGNKFPKLGLEPKHLYFALGIFNNSPKAGTVASNNFLDSILEYIEGEWLRVMENIYQTDQSSNDPWRNTGNVKGYKNDTFEVHAYDWGWDYDDDTPKSQPINFKWRDLEITWYKYCGRGLETNRPTTHDELALMLEECLESLIREERLHDEFER